MVQLRQRRLELLDSIRGLVLISMILYHGIWDLVYLYGMQWPWFQSEWGYLWQQSICWTFIILSGFCWQLGRQHLKRGLTVLAGGVVVSVVTALVLPEQAVRFGILTLIGSGMVVLIPLQKWLDPIPPAAGMAGSFLLFVLTRNLADGYLGMAGLTLVQLPEMLYRNPLTAYVGMPPRGFSSSDYFPLMPWLFLFVFGYFLYSFLQQHGTLEKFFTKGNVPLLNWMGKHSLWIYLLHQPVIYGLCELFLR